jgi:hypothetical protein
VTPLAKIGLGQLVVIGRNPTACAHAHSHKGKRNSCSPE